MKGFIWSIIVLINAIVCASTTVLAGENSFQNVSTKLSSSSSLYSIEGKKAWWHGKTSFSGTVIEPGCSVMMENLWQSTSIKKINPSEIKSNIYQYEAPFTLFFKNCDMIKSKVSVGDNIRSFFKSSSTKNKDLAIYYTLVNQTVLITGIEKFTPIIRSNHNDSKLDFTLRLTTNEENLNNKFDNLSIWILISQE